MNKENNTNIKVVSGDKFAISYPKLFWGTDKPNSETYINSIKSQIFKESSKNIKYLRFNDWYLIGSKFDWIESGLIDGKSEDDLFNNMSRYSDKNGSMGVRVEYLIKVYTNHVILWRNNSIKKIKGAGDNLIQFLEENYIDHITIGFKI